MEKILQNNTPQFIDLSQKKAWRPQDIADYTGWGLQYVYKLHGAGKIPGASKPLGKSIFFDSSKVIAWLLGNPQLTAEEIEQKATDYITTNPQG